MDNPLFCLVCGFERGGTTLIAELIRQHPTIDGRFECGFLLVDRISDYASLDVYVRNLKAGWGLSQQAFEYILQSATHQEAYRRLVERSNLPNKDVQIYDKTPRYMQNLTRILGMVDVPCICVVRDPRALYWSRQKHWDPNKIILGRLAKLYQLSEKLTSPNFIKRWSRKFFGYRHRVNRINMYTAHYLNYAEGWKAANESYPDRILLVRHEALCTNPKEETQRIYDFLDLEFRDEFLTLPTTPDPYVDRGGIRPNLIYEYQQGLSKREQDIILRKTKKFSDWHWLK